LQIIKIRRTHVKIYQQLLDWKEKRNDPALDKEAIRVVNSMPAWNPGMKNGQLVRVKYTVPITFRL
jgi:protein TonB